ncbi:arsenic resistance protein [Paeniglutamicibacter gangotriensis]|uniref:Arsenic resistance protein n=1 Tax=Paeniglutamicibacter gangotriensis TaxID=254787 RepID=A0A5B0E348_9MICC|nr:bile acid:sodium symporter [Paeniglutamicibacter gangotriensis]KAA0973086.1 arsenic resistance protein [Paeniglutamicibacter gangotriensis]
MPRIIRWWDKHQISLYLAAIALGASTGLAVPQLAPDLERSIEPTLILMLFATFLGIPLIEVGRAFRDIRFLGTVLITNFTVIPAIAFGLSRFVADDRGLLLGVLLVLLTPCIDYVIVFTGLAGGSSTRLLAATPLLMLVQILLLPVYLFFFADSEVLGMIEIAPFAEAFLLLIVLPLAAAAIIQFLARRHRVGRRIEETMAGAMVPLMMATLAVVIGSQIAAVGAQVFTLARVVPLYIAFVVIAVLVGKLAGWAARLDIPDTRAVMFSATTRNSLVVLPLALALPEAMDIVSLAVVTQTMIELIAMVVLVRLWAGDPIRSGTSSGHHPGR